MRAGRFDAGWKKEQMGLKRSVRGWMESMGLRTPPTTFQRRQTNLDGTITTGHPTGGTRTGATKRSGTQSTGRTRQSKVDMTRPTGIGKAIPQIEVPVSQMPPEFDYDEGNPPS
jgi:hypothetical protein